MRAEDFSLDFTLSLESSNPADFMNDLGHDDYTKVEHILTDFRRRFRLRTGLDYLDTFRADPKAILEWLRMEAQ